MTPEALEHILVMLLDEIRMRAAISREMLRYHPKNPSCPRYFRDAEWERRIARPRAIPRTTRAILFLSWTPGRFQPGFAATTPGDGLAPVGDPRA